MNKNNHGAKIIRLLTVAPLMAMVALSIILLVSPEIFRNNGNYFIALLFLTVLPLLGYPLQPFIPGFCDKGRDGQRNLAIIMAVFGYVLGIFYVLLTRATQGLLVIYLTYLLSGIGIAIFNKVLKVRASGHTCGIAGPIALLFYVIGYKALWGLIVLIMVFWASLKIKRHTMSQLIWGSIIPLAALFVAINVVY